MPPKPHQRLAAMYKPQASEEVCGVHAQNPPMYKAQGAEGVLTMHAAKTPQDPCALYIGAKVRVGFKGVDAHLEPCALYRGVYF